MCEQCVHVCAMCVYTAAVQALQVCAWVVCVRVHSGAAASQRVHELARGSQRQQLLPAVRIRALRATDLSFPIQSLNSIHC